MDCVHGSPGSVTLASRGRGEVDGVVQGSAMKSMDDADEEVFQGLNPHRSEGR